MFQCTKRTKYNIESSEDLYSEFLGIELFAIKEEKIYNITFSDHLNKGKSYRKLHRSKYECLQ